jgi:hypothetical protein
MSDCESFERPVADLDAKGMEGTAGRERDFSGGNESGKHHVDAKQKSALIGRPFSMRVSRRLSSLTIHTR